jgi:hypothetical protein
MPFPGDFESSFGDKSHTSGRITFQGEGQQPIHPIQLLSGRILCDDRQTKGFQADHGGVENLAAIDRRKAIAKSHRRCQTSRENRDH